MFRSRLSKFIYIYIYTYTYVSPTRSLFALSFFNGNSVSIYEINCWRRKLFFFYFFVSCVCVHERAHTHPRAGTFVFYPISFVPLPSPPLLPRAIPTFPFYYLARNIVRRYLFGTLALKYKDFLMALLQEKLFLPPLNRIDGPKVKIFTQRSIKLIIFQRNNV